MICVLGVYTIITYAYRNTHIYMLTPIIIYKIHYIVKMVSKISDPLKEITGNKANVELPSLSTKLRIIFIQVLFIYQMSAVFNGATKIFVFNLL